MKTSLTFHDKKGSFSARKLKKGKMIIKKYFMKSVKRITKDFKQKELLPLKLVFFVQATTLSVLYPYLTIHMRELGINVEEAAIMSAVIPVIGIIMPPLAGMVADKIGNFKLLLAFFSLIGGAASLLLLVVPVGRLTVTYPDRVIMDFGCGLGDEGDHTLGYPQFGHYSEIPCDQVPSLNSSDTDYDLSLSLEGCGFVCRSEENPEFQSKYLEENSTNPVDRILKGRSYLIQIQTESGVKSYRYNLTKEDVPNKNMKEDALSHRIMANDGHLDTSVRKVAPTEYYFPANGLSHFNCKKVPNESGKTGESLVCEVGLKESDEGLPWRNNSVRFGLQQLQEREDFQQFRSNNISWIANESLPLTCGRSNAQKGEDVSVFVYYHNPENNLEILDTFPLKKCEPRCLMSSMRKSICSNLKEEIEYNPQLTFWSYLVVRVFIGIIGSTSYAMYEVAVIAILREQKADYGLQRIYASIGGMISSPLSGILIDYASQGKGYTDFRPAFYLYAGLKMSTSILMLFINLEFKKAAANVITDAITVLKNLEIIALLAACFVLGTAWGYIESFLFWFLEDLGGTRSLMGITITVGGIAGIPLLILSGPIIDKIGHANVLFIGFIFYAIRLVGYSVIYNPYHCLYFEAMESITSSLAITAAITYAAKLSTTTTDGSVQGLVGGLYFGVGRGAGGLIGGYLMKAFGTRETFRIFAVFSVLTGIVYYLFNQFYLTKRLQRDGRETCKKEPKPNESTESDLKIITEKPKAEQLENTPPENNNTEKEDGNTISDARTPEVQEHGHKEENGSHTNPGFVPEESKEKEENDLETKKKD